MSCTPCVARRKSSVDSVLLGRFLAGECDDRERAQVEMALTTHPELQLLADLVRDVLCEAPPIETTSPQTTLAPQVTPTVLPFTPRKRRPFAWQRLGTLAAAACLLLVIGAGMFPLTDGLGGSASESPLLALGDGSASRQPLAMMVAGSPETRGGLPGELSLPLAEVGPPSMDAPLGGTAVASTVSSNQLPLVQPRPLPPNAARQVYQLTQQGSHYQREGQVDQAAHALELAHRLCEKRVGPQHPQTRMVAMNLAHMYGDALNQPTKNALEYPAVRSKPVPAPGLKANPPLATPDKMAPEGLAEGGPHRIALRSRLERRKAIEIQQRVVPVLSMGLRHSKQTDDRVTLIGALSELGPSAHSSVGILTARLQDSTEPREQVAIVEALRRIGPDARQALPVLNHLATQESMVMPTLPRQAQELIAHLHSPAGRVGVHDAVGLFSVAAVRDAVEHFQQSASKREVFVEVARPGPFPVAKARLKHLGTQALVVVIRRNSVEIQPSATLKTDKPLPLEAIRNAMQEHLRNEDPDAALREAYRLSE